MFYQDAYAPKPLDSKGLHYTRRSQTTTGPSAKPITKYEILRPYFDYDISAAHASKIAQGFLRYIKGTRKFKKETKLFLEDVLNKIIFLHKYNVKVAEITSKYPLNTDFTQLLLHYIVLECNVLYRKEFYSPFYEVLVEKRILRLLLSIYNSYFETLAVPPKKLYPESVKAILKLLMKIKLEFDVQNELLKNTVIKLLEKIGELENVAAIKEKCIPCPLDSYLSSRNSSLLNTCKNIITSDYGTDEDFKFEEDEIQVVVPEQNDNDSRDTVDVRIKLEIDDLIRKSNRLYQHSESTPSTKVPTICIDDDDDEILYWEDEVKSSSKALKRLEKEEARKAISRERTKRAFATHRPIEDKLADIKPDVKEEIIDLELSENEDTSAKNSTSMEKISSAPLDESVLIVSSDEDETFNNIPKEREIELLEDDDGIEIASKEDQKPQTQEFNCSDVSLQNSKNSFTVDTTLDLSVKKSNPTFTAVDNKTLIENLTEEKLPEADETKDQIFVNSEDQKGAVLVGSDADKELTSTGIVGPNNNESIRKENLDICNIEDEDVIPAKLNELRDVVLASSETVSERECSKDAGGRINDTTVKTTDGYSIDNRKIRSTSPNDILQGEETDCDRIEGSSEIVFEETLLEKLTLNVTGVTATESVENESRTENKVMFENMDSMLGDTKLSATESRDSTEHDSDGLPSRHGFEFEENSVCVEKTRVENSDIEYRPLEEELAIKIQNVTLCEEPQNEGNNSHPEARLPIKEPKINNVTLTSQCSMIDTETAEILDVTDNPENESIQPSYRLVMPYLTELKSMEQNYLVCASTETGYNNVSSAELMSLENAKIETKSVPIPNFAETEHSLQADETTTTETENRSNEGESLLETVNEPELCGVENEETTKIYKKVIIHSVDVFRPTDVDGGGEWIQAKPGWSNGDQELSLDNREMWNEECQSISENVDQAETNMSINLTKINEETDDLISKVTEEQTSLLTEDRSNLVESVSDLKESNAELNFGESHGKKAPLTKECNEIEKVESPLKTISKQTSVGLDSEVEQLSQSTLKGTKKVYKKPKMETSSSEKLKHKNIGRTKALSCALDEEKNRVPIKLIKCLSFEVGDNEISVTAPISVSEEQDKVDKQISRDANLETSGDKTPEMALSNSPEEQIASIPAPLSEQDCCPESSKSMEDIKEVTDKIAENSHEIKNPEQFAKENYEVVEEEFVGEAEIVEQEGSEQAAEKSSNQHSTEQNIARLVNVTESSGKSKYYIENETYVENCALKCNKNYFSDGTVSDGNVEGKEDCGMKVEQLDLESDLSEIEAKEECTNNCEEEMGTDEQKVFDACDKSVIAEVHESLGDTGSLGMSGIEIKSEDDAADVTNPADVGSKVTKDDEVSEPTYLNISGNEMESKAEIEAETTTAPCEIQSETKSFLDDLRKEEELHDQVVEEVNSFPEEVVPKVELSDNSASACNTDYTDDQDQPNLKESHAPEMAEDENRSDKETEVMNDLSIQKEEIVGDTDEFDSHIYQEISIVPVETTEDQLDMYNKTKTTAKSQVVVADTPTDISFGGSDSLLKKLDVLKKIGTEILVTSGNNQLIPEQVVQNLDIHQSVDNSTSLDILATVATEVSRQDLLRVKRSKKGAPKRKAKTGLNVKPAKKEGPLPHKGKKAVAPTNRCTTRSAFTKTNEQLKCKPHDFLVNNSKVLPPTNNIYTHKLTETSVTSEDSNDSEGNLFIDEGLDRIARQKETSKEPPLKEKLIVKEDIACYEEDTLEGDIICMCELRVKGTVLISIPDNFQDTFDILKQIEDMEQCGSKNEDVNSVEKDKEHDEPRTVPEMDYVTEGTETTDNAVCREGDSFLSPKENEHAKQGSSKPFRTMAERKDYDKLKLNPYVSIERLNISVKEKPTEEPKLRRSKSFDLGIIRESKKSLYDAGKADIRSQSQPVPAENQSTDINQTVTDATEKNSTPEELVEDTTLLETSLENQLHNEVPQKVKDGSIDNIDQSDSDLDDMPLLQRSQKKQTTTRRQPRTGTKQKRRRLDNKFKRVKNRRKITKDKKQKKSEISVGHVKDLTVKKKKSVKFDKLEKGATLNNKQHENISGTHLSVDLGNKDEPDNSLISKSLLNLNTLNSGSILENNSARKQDDSVKIEAKTADVEDAIKSSNKKYYTTPKLRGKSMSKDSLSVMEKSTDANRPEENLSNTVENKSDEKKLFSLHKKYYTPPKLRRKSVIENEVLPTKELLPKKVGGKQLKPTPTKIDMLSRCKNTVSPTTEKLKKKLETDFNLCHNEILEETPNSNPLFTADGMFENMPNIEYHKTTMAEQGKIGDEKRPEVGSERYEIQSENQISQCMSDIENIFCSDSPKSNVHEGETISAVEIEKSLGPTIKTFEKDNTEQNKTPITDEYIHKPATLEEPKEKKEEKKIKDTNVVAETHERDDSVTNLHEKSLNSTLKSSSSEEEVIQEDLDNLSLSKVRSKMKANDASTKSGKNAGSDENILKRSSSFTEINMQGLQIKHKERKSRSKSDTDVKDVDNSSLAKSPESKKRTEAMKSDNINTDNKQALSKGAESKMVTGKSADQISSKKEKSVVENKDVDKNLDVKSISEISKQRKSKERKTNQISENKSKSQSASAKNISVAPNKKEAVLARKLDVTSEMEKKDKELSLKSKSSHSEKQKTKIHDKTDSSRRDGDKKHRDRSSSRSSSVSSTSSRHARDSKKSKREHHSSKSKSPATKLESGVSISVSLKKDDPNNSNKHDKSKSRSSHRSSSSSTKSHAPDSLKTVNSRNHKSSRDKRDHSSSRKSHSKTNSVAIASPITDVIPKNNVDKRVSSSETKANVNIEISSQTSSKPVTKADSEVRTSSKKGNKMEEKEVRREDKKRSNTHKNLHHKNSSKSKTVNNDSVAKSKHNRDKKTCKQEKVRPSPKKANEILMDKPEINKEVVISVDNSKVNNNFENKDLSLRDDVNTKEEEEEANSVLLENQQLNPKVDQKLESIEETSNVEEVVNFAYNTTLNDNFEKKDESLGDNVNIGILEADNVLLENHPLKQKGDQNLESTPNEETSNVQEVIGIADNISVNDDFVKQDINPGDDGTTETLEENRGLLENQPLKQKVDKKLESTPNEETSNVEEGITFADNITVNDNDNITVNDNFEENDMSVDDVNTKKLEANRVLSENHSSTQKVDQSLESVANEEASNVKDATKELELMETEQSCESGLLTIQNTYETNSTTTYLGLETTEKAIQIKETIVEDKYIDNEDIDNANEVTKNEIIQQVQETTENSIGLKDNIIENEDIDNANEVKADCNIKVTDNESVQLIQATTGKSIQLKDNVVEDKDIDNTNDVKTHNIKVTEIESVQLIQETTELSIQLKDNVVEDKDIDNPNGVKTHNIKVTEIESIQLIQQTTDKSIQLKDAIVEDKNIDNDNGVKTHYNIKVTESESIRLIQETEKCIQLKDIIIEGEDIDNTNEVTKDHDIQVAEKESVELIQETTEKSTELKYDLNEDKYIHNVNEIKMSENESSQLIQGTTEKSAEPRYNIIEDKDIDNVNDIKRYPFFENESSQVIQKTTEKSIELSCDIIEDKDIDNVSDIKRYPSFDNESSQVIQKTTEKSIEPSCDIIEDKDIDNVSHIKRYPSFDNESSQVIQKTTEKSIEPSCDIIEDKDIDNVNDIKRYLSFENKSSQVIQKTTEKSTELSCNITEDKDIDNVDEIKRDSDITVSDNESFHLIQETPEKLTEPKLNITEDKDTANESKRDCNKVNENESIKHIQDIDNLITVENRNASLTPNVDLVDSKKVTDTEQDDLKVLEDSNVNISEEIIIKDVCAKDGEEIISTNVKNYEEFRGTKEFPNNNLTESKKTDECFAPGNETVCEGDMIGLKSGVIKQTNNVSTIMEKLIPKNDHSTKNVAVKSRKEVESSTRTKLQKIQDAFEKYLPTKSKENKPLETSQQSTSICKNLLQDDLPPDVAVISKEERSTGKRGISMLEADPVIEEKLLPAPVKKTKFDEISVIVSTSENPKLLGPLSISPKKKERKSIESIISHLREGKSNEEITKNSTNIEAIDVTVLKEKLLLKIKNTSEQHSVKALDEISSDSVDQTICKKQANLISGDIEGKEVSDSNMEEDETFHISENVEKEVAEDMEKGKVSHNVQIPERSQTNENECPVELLDDSQKDNLKHQVNAVRNVDVDHGNKEPQSVTLIESQLVCQETKNKSDISTPSCEMCPKVLEPMTPTSKEILSSDLPESLKIIDNYDNQNNIVAHISTSNDFINSPVIEEDVIVKLEAEECSQHSLNEVIESSFVEDSLHISTSLTTSFTDLMMHVDQDPTSVTNMGEITVSPEDVCMLSDIISTSISSGENKLPCVSSTSHIKLFTFPVTTQADIKDHFIPLGDVTANKNASLEKLGSREDKGCVFSFSERTNIATSETLSSTELSLNLQADPFSKISIGSTRTLDLISTKPLSVVQTASNSNFMGNVPVSNEISDIITEITCSGEADDHNYTMGSIGGPLLSGRPEEKNILSTTYNKLLVETSEFPLNDNPLQEFPEFGDNNLREIMPDDTYKLNLDNEYAVKNVVMLAGQTSSDASAFPLSNYNLADIERINLIECNIPNSEENSNSKEYLDLSNMEQNQKTSSNDVNPWSQFIMNENPNQKVVVLPNEQCLMSSFSISQNDLIESFNEQVVENLSSSASVDKICPSPPLDISGNILEKTSTSPEISTTQKSPDAQKPKEPNVLKNNLQKSKKNVPDKSSPKDLRETDFLPRRRYSRTVLKAPKKKTTPSPRVGEPPKETTAKTTDGISSVPTKKVTPALGGTNPTVENKLPSVEERPTELFNLESLKLDSIAVPTSHNAVNRSLGPSLEVLLKQPEIEKVTPSHLPVPHNSTPDLRKTVENQVTTTNVSESPPKDGAENIVKNPEDAAVTETKRTAKTVQQTVEGAIEPETEKLEVQTNIADHVKANKRAATNKYNLNNYSPSSVSMVKEAAARKTETKLKLSTVERSTVDSAPGVAEVKSKSDASNPEKEHRKTPSYKSPGGRLDLASAFKLLHQLNDKRKSPRQSGSNSQKNSPNHHAVDKSSLSVNASTVRKTETKLKQSSVERATAESTPGVVEAKPKCDISNAEREHRKTPINKSPGGRLNFISAFKLLHQLDDKRKSPGQTSSDSQKNSPSHALDKTSLSVHASTRKTLPAKNAPDQPVAETPKKPCSTDYRHANSRGVKRAAPNAEEGERETGLAGAKKMKEGARSPRSEEKKDLFDKLVEQANVNKLISFRVTDDNKLKIERRNSPLMNRDRGRERNEPGPGHSRSAFHPAHDRPSGKGGEEERRPHASERRARPYGSDQSPYASTRQRTTRERQHGDYSREGDRYHSEEFRRREALHGSHSSRHHSDYVRGRETRAGHISSAPHLSGSVRLHSLRSSNVADSSNKRSTSHLTHSSSASGATVRQSSGPYAKRNTKMSPEKQDALLNSLKDKVLDKPSSKDRRKGNDEGEYSWIERMNQCIDKDLLTPSNASTPQFIPSVPSPRNDYK